MSVSYIVEGMTCGGCSKSVINALKSVKESAEIQVDLETKKVTVSGLDDEGAIKDAIENAGFDFMGKA
jgi:copper chaperone